MPDEPTKSCYRCKITKTLEEFHFDKHTKDGHVNICKGCARSRDRAKYGRVREKQITDARRWNITHPEQYLDYQLRRTYGITLVEYNAMLADQGGVCAICGGVDKAALSVDHDAETGHIRGLLCGHCNRAIGMLRHDPARTRAATAYLEASIQRRERTRAPAIWEGHAKAADLYQHDTGG